MSGALKSLGKVFKKVAKVIKKYALPILAIGAVVLTGGAALGVLPAIGGAGGLGAALGLSPALTGIISTAATSATVGAVGAGLTGGNIVKGATAGLVTGAALGAAGQLLGPGAGIAKTAASGAAANGGGAMSYTSPAIDGAPMAIPSSGAPIAAPSGGIGSGVLGFLERNPNLSAGLVQGIGGGLIASENAKEERKRDARIGENYGGYNGLNLGSGQIFGASTVPGGAPSGSGPITFDPTTGRFITRKA